MKDKSNESERLEWMCANLGKGRAVLDEYKETFHLGEARYYEDRKQALALMKDKLSADADQWKTDLISRLEELYRRNVDSSRTQGVALDVLKVLAKLTGNDENVVKVESTIPKIKWDIEDGSTGSE